MLFPSIRVSKWKEKVVSHRMSGMAKAGIVWRHLLKLLKNLALHFEHFTLHILQRRFFFGLSKNLTC